MLSALSVFSCLLCFMLLFFVPFRSLVNTLLCPYCYLFCREGVRGRGGGFITTKQNVLRQNCDFFFQKVCCNGFAKTNCEKCTCAQVILILCKREDQKLSCLVSKLHENSLRNRPHVSGSVFFSQAQLFIVLFSPLIHMQKTFLGHENWSFWKN